MVKSRRNVSRRKRQHKRQQKRQKSIRRNFKKMWGGGLISNNNDAKTKLSTAMINDAGYKNKIGEQKESLLTTTLTKLNEITDFDEYPAFGAPNILAKSFVNNVLKFKEYPHQANMLKIAAADEKAGQLEKVRLAAEKADRLEKVRLAAEKEQTEKEQTEKERTEKDYAFYETMGERAPRPPPDSNYGFGNN